MHTLDTPYRFQAGSYLVIARTVQDDDVDTSFDETGETADKIASGEWQAFGTIVDVIDQHGVVIGSDSLWGSIYADPEEFFTAHRDSNPENRNCSIKTMPGVIGHYFPGMVRNATREAREYLRGVQARHVRAA